MKSNFNSIMTRAAIRVNLRVKFAKQHLEYLNEIYDRLDTFEQVFIQSLNLKQFELHFLSTKQFNRLLEIYERYKI